MAKNSKSGNPGSRNIMLRELLDKRSTTGRHYAIIDEQGRELANLTTIASGWDLLAKDDGVDLPE